MSLARGSVSNLEGTMKRNAVFFGVALACSLSAGCRKTKFGAGCEKSADLSAPWTELSQPNEEDKTPVCSTTPDELKLRSYTWTSAEEAQPAFEKVLTAAGYQKDRCSGPACYYDKAGTTISVHPIPFKVEKKSLITVVLTQRPDASRKAR
jgi:hypothetical protein